jgi:Cft2 family RNA processing exonuclease
MDDCRITLYPAGHILGSAMILFEKNGMRLLYTGDFKLQPGLTSEAIQVPKADVLIMESTYGHPDYCFNQKRNKLKDELNQWIDETRHNGEMPVLLAYRVGKSQEAMKMVSDMGYKVSVHPSIWEYTQIYQKFGVDFCNCTPHYDEYDSSFDVFIIPPHVAHRHVNDSFRRYRTLFLSGWAESRQAKPWVFGNQALSFSDHADFNELLQFVRMVNPQKVFTLHGFKEFPIYLKKAGYDAQFLSR